MIAILIFVASALRLAKASEVNFMFLDEVDTTNPFARRMKSEHSSLLIEDMHKKSIQSLPFQPDPLNPNGPVTYTTSKCFYCHIL
jgi:hypothetical protein